MKDILERLIEFASVERHFENPIYHDAAEEISKLRKRFVRLSTLMDGLNGVDFHEQAFSAAVGAGRDSPNESDYYSAVCFALDVEYEAESTEKLPGSFPLPPPPHTETR